MLLFKNVVLKPVMEELQETGGNLLLVKDFGESLGKEDWETFSDQVIHRGYDVFIDVREDSLRIGYLEPGTII